MEKELVVVNTKIMCGAIVSAPYELAESLGLVVVPLEFCSGIEVYEFLCTYKGLEALVWAKFWLVKRDKRARSIGLYTPTPDLRRESIVTHRMARKAFDSEVSRKNRSLRKKVKMVGGLYNHSLF